MTNADPHDLPPGAAVSQDNCFSRRAGELSVRRGLHVVEFDDLTGASVQDSQLICIQAVNQPHASFVVYLNALGNVRIGKNPQ